MTVSMHEAQTHFSELVKKANEGEEVIITKHGEPVATLNPIGKSTTKRTGGFFQPKAQRSMPTPSQWKEMNDDMLNDFSEAEVEVIDFPKYDIPLI